MKAVPSVGPAIWRTLALLAAFACAHPSSPPASPTPKRPRIEGPAQQADSQLATPDSGLPPPHRPIAPAALARMRGWMPLASTGVPAFLAVHPAWDGRGVLIAILDSGLDPGVPGLDSTSAARPKVLDLRDFSGEGRIPLSLVIPRGDTVEVAGRRLGGFGRVRALAAGGPWYGGFLGERRLGELPASDLNDNGTDSDSLVLVVGKASDGWVLFADTDGDGSLANERAVHDFLVARETFGWHRAGAPPPLNLAANFGQEASGPLLDLVFDTDAHGTHVAGIAAARGIGGAGGFDGVAPGAQLLGLKISRNDFGGLTTTGSVVAALDYAIRFALTRRMPLVVNMSFGVGNEREGAARLDAQLDSMLTAHPEVTFVTSAGNDGPGLSTMGFPGSLRRGITVGATEPAVFFTLPGRLPLPRDGLDLLLFFSSRGGELAKPDLVAPGTAYSTVPRWNMGEELKSGTSMASPHVAGLAAILLSAALAEHRAVLAEDLRRALTAAARPLPGQTVLDAGAGLPDLDAAWQVLQSPAPAADFDVEIPDRPGTSAAFSVGPTDTLVRFRIHRTHGTTPVELSFSSEAPWLAAPGPVRVAGADLIITLVQHPPAATPGSYTGAVRASIPGVAAPLFRLVTTVVLPEASSAASVRVRTELAACSQRRFTFVADSGRPFRVSLATAAGERRLVAALHQPGGAPILGDNGIPGGADTAAAVFDVDGRDARRGLYEAVAVAPLDGPVTASLSIDHAPVLLQLAPVAADSLTMVVSSSADSTVSGRFNLGLFGGERRVLAAGSGGSDVLIPFPLPAWASRLVVDLELDPEQWPHFTDFGLTALDSAGRILGKGPANYAHARLTAELASRPVEQIAAIALAPGFAEPGSREHWSGRLTIRLEAKVPVALEAKEGDEFHLGGKGTATFHARIAELPWWLPDGFDPLGMFLVESGGMTWSWQLPILRPPATTP